jgi:hypothetical protein
VCNGVHTWMEKLAEKGESRGTSKPYVEGHSLADSPLTLTHLGDGELD